MAAHQHPTYRADIDGLRAIAVLLVVGFHAFGSVVKGGFIGVDVFFVISGFLISKIIFDDLDRGSFSFKDFYVRRIQRIFPALIVVTASCAALGWFALRADEYRQLGKHLAAGASFAANFIFWRESGYFDTAAATKPLLHLWSLAIEEQFYLAWPVLLWAACRWRLKRSVICGVLIAASFALNIAYSHGNPLAAFYSPLARIWELLAGGLLACFAHRLPAANETPARQPWRQAMAFAGVALLAAGVLSVTKDTIYPGWWGLLPVTGAVLLIAAGPGAWINRRILASRVLVWFGLISYPLYLWHWPMLIFAHFVEAGTEFGELSTEVSIAIVVLSIGFAWLTYRLLETPIRRGPYRAYKPAVLGLAIIALGAAGGTIYRNDGLPLRAANQSVALYADILTPAAARITDDSCQRLLGRAAVGGAVCLTRSAQPEILIMGDSHAMAVNSAAFLERYPLNTLLLASHGCLPFLSYQNYAPQDNRSAKTCFKIAQEGVTLARTIASVRTVILISRGPLYFSGRGFGMEENDPHFRGWTVEPLQATPAMSSQEAFVNGYVEVSRQLLATGKKVVFAIDVPEFGINPEVCISNRPLALRNRKLANCDLPRAVVDQRQAEYRQLLARIKAQVPQLQIYDSTPVFCNATICSSKTPGHVYFYDNNHVNLFGSKLLLDDLNKSVLQR